VLSGGVLARLLSLAALPLITRLYSPVEIGSLALLTSYVLMLAPFLSLRYVMALPLEEDRYREKSLYNTIVLILFLFSLVLVASLLYIVVYGWSLTFFLLPFLAVFAALYEVVMMFFSCESRFKDIVRMQLAQSFFEAVVKVLLGLLVVGGVGLYYGYSIFLVIPTVFLIYRYRDTFSNLLEVKFDDFFRFIKSHKAFVFYRVPSQVLLVFSMQFPVLSIAYLFDTKELGYAALAFTLLAVPVTLVTQAVGNIFYANFSKFWVDDKKISKVYMVKTFALVLSFSMFLAFVLYLTSESVVGFMFGVEWIVAGKVMSILSLYFCFQLASAPMINSLSTIGDDVFYLVINALRGVVLFLYFLYFNYQGEGFFEYIYGYSIVMLVVYLVLIFLISWRVYRA
jgi:O-antigen/teichoic acid export membrane protein